MKFHLNKLGWAARAILYKPMCRKLLLPSYIGKPIFASGLAHISIGRRVRIFPGIRIEAIQDGAIKIEDNVYIGQNCHITSQGSELVIGTGTDVMANVCITNIDHRYQDIDAPVLEQGVDTHETVIGKNCFIGHGSVIQAGVMLGNHVIVGANSVVCKIIGGGGYPDNCVIVGAPARIVKKYNPESKQWEKY